MKVLAINGSPRNKGNTAFLIERALAGARKAGASVQRIDISSLNILPVTPEDYCAGINEPDKRCSDDLDIIVDSIKSSESVIIACPIFFGSIPGQLKVMIDRFQFAWLEKKLLGRDVFPDRKRGAFISVQAQERSDFFDNASSIVRHFFATANISYEGEVFCGGLEGESDASNHPEFSTKAYSLGLSMGSGI